MRRFIFTQGNMRHVFFFLFLLLCLNGHDESNLYSVEQPVFVKDGDSVTLHTDVEANQQSRIMWTYGGSCIAELRGDLSVICTDVYCDKDAARFRDRLKLDHQTGSLTVINTTNTDSGLYHLEIHSTRASISERIFRVFIEGVFCASTDEEPVSVMEGNSVTLHTDSKANQQDGVLIAEITADQSQIRRNDDYYEERFTQRLNLDRQTRSLTIRNIRNADYGRIQLIIRNILKGFGVSVASSYRDNIKTLPVFVMEGDSLTLLTDVKMNQHDNIKWEFQYTHIAGIRGDLSFICTDVQCDEGAERFRHRLKLDHQTGSLTIMNISNTHSGLYYLEIFSGWKTELIFNVTVNADHDEVKRKSVKEGESVTLHPGEINKTNETNLLKWYFNETCIVEITDGPNKTCEDDQCDERFRNRLKVDNQTGSLTITNITTEHTGLYKLEIINSRFSISRNFNLTVISSYSDDIKRLPVFVMEGDSLTLLTDVKINQHDTIRWEFQYTHIAGIRGDLSFICTDVQCNKDAERFRHRLKLDNQTGSLTIMNISNTHSGLYYLQISNGSINEIIFNVTVNEDHDEVKRKSVKEGESVTLHPGEINKTNETNLLKWYFNETCIVEITDGPNKTCEDDQCDERFRNRLKVDNQTGSLTITNITTEHAGLYKLEIINSRFSISRNFTLTVIESRLPLLAVGPVILFLAAAAFVIYYYKAHARRKDMQQRGHRCNQAKGVEDSPPDQNDTLLTISDSPTNQTEAETAIDSSQDDPRL